MLNSSALLLLGSLINMGADRPAGLGVSRFNGFGSLGLCPRTPTCISTAEELNDEGHFVPPWTYNPEEGRGRKAPASREQAVEELVAVLTKGPIEGYQPTLVKRTEDYVYVEFKKSTPFISFLDDFECARRSVVQRSPDTRPEPTSRQATAPAWSTAPPRAAATTSASRRSADPPPGA